jgi:hypothetical protein
MLFDVPRPRIELYDLREDPWETVNIAETPDGKKMATRLEAMLDDWAEQNILVSEADTEIDKSPLVAVASSRVASNRLRVAVTMLSSSSRQT